MISELLLLGLNVRVSHEQRADVRSEALRQARKVFVLLRSVDSSDVDELVAA
jgi:hypothetical protein